MDKEVLNFKCKIINNERLEKLVLNKICEVSKNILEDIEEEKPLKKEETDINTNSEELFIDPNSQDILLLKTSLFYRFGEEYNLGYNISFKKVLNCNLFNGSKAFLKIFNGENNCAKYKKDCILLTKDIFNIKKI